MLSKDVKVEYQNNNLSVAGKLGKLSMVVNRKTDLKIESDKIFVIGKGADTTSRDYRCFTGLTWALVRNLVIGVTEGFTKKLEIRGIGFNAQVNGPKLVMKLGFTNPVEVAIPEGIKVALDQKGVFMDISGIDKHLVGEFSAQVRHVKPPEPYKGTGIRYVNEYVIKKVGKAAAGATGAPGAAGGGAAGASKGGKK